MINTKILVIEDSKNILELVRYNLEKSGFSVSTARDGEEGLAKVTRLKPDLILLDLMLPGVDGMDICKSLKQQDKTSHIPIIMLTAKSEETDKVLGLELGADDYITKPFSPREMIARIRAVLRRGKKKVSSKLLKIGFLEMDTDRHIVRLKKKTIDLTSKEYRLLQVFLKSDGRVLTRDYLLNHVWGYDQSLEIETRTVDMHVGQLRKKLGVEGRRILTVKNEGYRFENE